MGAPAATADDGDDADEPAAERPSLSREGHHHHHSLLSGAGRVPLTAGALHSSNGGDGEGSHLRPSSRRQQQRQQPDVYCYNSPASLRISAICCRAVAEHRRRTFLQSSAAGGSSCSPSQQQQQLPLLLSSNDASSSFSYGDVVTAEAISGIARIVSEVSPVAFRTVIAMPLLADAAAFYAEAGEAMARAPIPPPPVPSVTVSPLSPSTSGVSASTALTHPTPTATVGGGSGSGSGGGGSGGGKPQAQTVGGGSAATALLVPPAAAPPLPHRSLTVRFVALLNGALALEQAAASLFGMEPLGSEMRTVVLQNFFAPQAARILEAPPSPSPSPLAAGDISGSGRWLEAMVDGADPQADLRAVLGAYALTGELPLVIARMREGIVCLGTDIALGHSPPELAAAVGRSAVTAAERENSSGGVVKDSAGRAVASLPKTISSVPVVEATIAFVETFTATVKNVFFASSRLSAHFGESESLHKSIARVVNANPRMAEYLAFAIDAKIRAQCSEVDCSVFSDRVLKLYSLLDDKDVFDHCHQYLFSQRLLARYAAGGAIVVAAPPSSSTATSAAASPLPQQGPAAVVGTQRLMTGSTDPLSASVTSNGSSSDNARVLSHGRPYAITATAAAGMAQLPPAMTIGSNAPSSLLQAAAGAQMVSIAPAVGGAAPPAASATVSTSTPSTNANTVSATTNSSTAGGPTPAIGYTSANTNNGNNSDALNANTVSAPNAANSTTGGNAAASPVAFSADGQFQVLESLFLKRFRTANDAGFGAKLDAMLNDCRTSERLNDEFAQLMPARDPPAVHSSSSSLIAKGEEEDSDTPATLSIPAKKTVGGGGSSSAAEEEALAKAIRSVVADPSEISSDPIASLAIIEAHCWPRAAASMAYVGSSFGYYDNNGHIKKNNKNNNNTNSSRNTQQQWANGGDDGDEALSSEAAATALALRRLPAHVRKGTIPHQMHITVLTKGHWPLLSLGGGSGSGGFGGGGGNDNAGGGAECGGNVTGAGEKKKPSASGDGDSDGYSDGSSLHGFGGLSDGAPTAAPAALLRGLRLPSATVACMEVFRAFYKSKHRSRLLEFCLSQGSFDVLVRYTTSASSSSVSCSGNSSPNPQRQSSFSVDDNATANGTHQSSSLPPSSLQKRSILLNIPTFMAAPLLLFGPDGAALSIRQVAAGSGLPLSEAARAVAALMRQTSVCTPILRIASSSSSAFCSSQVPSSASASSSPLTSTTLTADTVVTFNTNFKSKVRFVKVCSVSMRAPAAAAADSSSYTAADGASKDAIGGGGGTSATIAGGGEGGVSIDPALVASAARGAVRRERPLELSAQIMRFMKQSSGNGNGGNDPSSSKKARAVAHGDLVKAVREALQHIFVPTPEEIKKGVEALIERDMLRRSDDLVGHYEYVA